MSPPTGMTAEEIAATMKDAAIRRVNALFKPPGVPLASGGWSKICSDLFGGDFAYRLPIKT
jgi:hypothetical protein